VGISRVIRHRWRALVLCALAACRPPIYIPNHVDDYVAVVCPDCSPPFYTGLLRTLDDVSLPQGGVREALYWSPAAIAFSCAPRDEAILAMYPLRSIQDESPRELLRALPPPSDTYLIDAPSFAGTLTADWPVEELSCSECCIAPDLLTPPVERRGGCRDDEVRSTSCGPAPHSVCCVGALGSAGLALRFTGCLPGETTYDARACAPTTTSSCTITRGCPSRAVQAVLSTADQLCVKLDNDEAYCRGSLLFRRASNLDYRDVHGQAHSCDIFRDGQLSCDGDNSHGQLGLGVGATQGGIVMPGKHWLAVGANAATSCAIDESRAVWCWGRNSAHQAGIEGSSDLFVPVRVIPGGARELVMRFETTCAIMLDDYAICWGANQGNVLGIDLSTGAQQTTLPTRIPGLRHRRARLARLLGARRGSRTITRADRRSGSSPGLGLDRGRRGR